MYYYYKRNKVFCQASTSTELIDVESLAANLPLNINKSRLSKDELNITSRINTLTFIEKVNTNSINQNHERYFSTDIIICCFKKGHNLQKNKEFIDFLRQVKCYIVRKPKESRTNPVTIIKHNCENNTDSVEVSVKIYEKYKHAIKYCHPDILFKWKFCSPPILNDPLLNHQFYFFQDISSLTGCSILECLSYITTNNIRTNPIKLAIFDCGINKHVDYVIRHPQVFKLLNTDLINISDIPYHATALASIVNCLTNNNSGMSSISPSTQILDCRIVSSNWNSDFPLWKNSVKKSVDEGCKILLLALGVEVNPQNDALEKLFKDTSKQMLVICASGNYDKAIVDCPIFFPACLSEVLCVGACAGSTNKPILTKIKAGTSRNKTSESRRNNVDLVAPGEGILCAVSPSIYQGRNYEKLDGTSYAAAIVAGIASLVLSINPALKPIRLKQLLIESCDDLNNSILYGHGRINALKAVENAYLSLTNNIAENGLNSKAGEINGDFQGGRFKV